MRLLCIDPNHTGGNPPIELAARFNGLRFVAFPHLWPLVQILLSWGWHVQLVLARESGPVGQYITWQHERLTWVIGNEPDGEGPSSWIMSPAEYAELWQASSALQGDRYVAGMSSGDVNRAAAYVNVAAGCAGIVAHLYTLTPAQAIVKVQDYQQLHPSVWVGEFHEVDGFTPDDYWAAFASAGGIYGNYFCYSDLQVPNFGLPLLTELQAAA